MENLSRVIILLFLFLPVSLYAADPLDVIINEIAWMGTARGWQYEWIELYNTSQKEIDISGWKIENAGQKGESIEIPEGKISPQTFFLICKKEIENCDFTTWNLSLKNNYKENGKLILVNDLKEKIDETPEAANSEWPAGDKKTKQTLERENSQLPGSNSLNWKTSQISGGTPKAKNSVSLVRESLKKQKSELQSPPKEESAVEEIKSRTYPSGIVIKEILPSPEGPDPEEEWIEIYNQNNFEVNLTDWEIEDTVGRTTIYTFPKGTKIGAKGFLVLSRPATKITLNNGGDGLNLIQPDGKIGDSVSYEKAPRNWSYNRTDSKWVWSTILTPGSENIIKSQETEKTEFSKEAEKIDINTAPLEDLVKIVNLGEIRARELISLRPFYSLDELTRIKGISDKTLKDIKKQGLAWVDPSLEPPKIEKTESFEKGVAAVIKPLKPESLGKQISKSLSIFLIALFLAIFSGIIILILKRKIKSIDLPKKKE